MSQFPNTLRSEDEHLSDLFHQTVLSSLLLSLFGNAVTFYNLIEVGWRDGMFFGYCFSIIIGWLYFFGQRLPLRTRAHIFQICWTVMFYASVLSLGFLTSFHPLPVLLCVTAIIFLGLREAVVQLLVCLAGYAIMLATINTPGFDLQMTYDQLVASTALKIHYISVATILLMQTAFVIAKYVELLKSVNHENAQLTRQRDILIDGIEEAPEPFAIWDNGGRMFYCNELFADELRRFGSDPSAGSSFEELLNKLADSGRYDVDPAERADWIARRLRGFFSEETREYHLADGRWQRSNERRTSRGFIASFRTDITELKQTENRLRFVTDNVQEAILVLSNSGGIIFANASACESFGYTSNELDGRDFSQLLAEDSSGFLRELLSVGDEAHPSPNDMIEIVCRRKNGESFRAGIKSQTAMIDGERAHVLVMQDYSLQSASEARVRVLYEAIQKMGAGVALFNQEHNLFFFNNDFKRFCDPIIDIRLGTSARDLASALVTSDSLTIQRPTPREIWRAFLQASNTGSTRIDITSAEGRRFQASIFTLADELKLILVIDATESKIIEDQLIQAAKLASLGEMATEIAHEINQPLNVIKLAASNVSKLMPSDSENAEKISGKLHTISEHVTRASSLVHQLRVYGREAKESDAHADPDACITAAIEMLGEEFRTEGIDIRYDGTDSLPEVRLHPIKLEQILVILLTNARDAHRERIGNDDGDQRIDVTLTSADLGSASITVTDNAGGISPEVLPKVLDPFFTTKQPGDGTGLGLSIANRIVTEAGGRIEVANTEAGARFTVKLPTNVS